MLRQPADKNAHRIDGVELFDRVLGKDVHHPRSQSTIGNDGDVFLLRFGVESLLLEDDLGIAAEVREVDARLNGQRCELVIEVVRDCAHRRVSLAHQRQHGFLVADVERREDQTLAGVRREELRQVAGMQIGQPDFLHFRILEEIISTRGALQPRAEY